MYKRESYPNGAVRQGSVTATFAGGLDRTGGYQNLDPSNSAEEGVSFNWFNQGADAGRYSNDDIHAIRILAWSRPLIATPDQIPAGLSAAMPMSACVSWARSR